MTDEERVIECQREIRRLRSVIRADYEENLQLTEIIRCLIKGMACEGYSPDTAEHLLVLGGASLDNIEKMREVK